MKNLFLLFTFFLFFTVSAQGYKYHVVQKGETVQSIARDFNVSLETLFVYNPDAKAGIREGSKLVVPVQTSAQSEEGVKFEEHKVKRKETLFSLSQEYKVSIEDIKRFNTHLYSAELRRGERIRIPVNLPSEAEQVILNPEANPLGISVKEHVVLPKETKFSISQRYNISVAELERLNPGIDVIQPGMALKVGVVNDQPTPLEEKQFKYYQVQPQETMYSLLRKLNISRDSLEVLNPALVEGLKAGMVLKIPNPDTGTIAEYSTDDFVNLAGRITNLEPKDLVIMLPFGLDKVITTDTTSNAADRIRKDKVLQISLDFYSGVLMAVDSAKALGISTNLKVYDTKQNTYEVSNIINTNNFNGVEAVIGPLLQSTAEAAVARLQPMNIPVVSPLTKRATKNWPNFVQARPTDEMLREAMMSYLIENGQGKNIVIIADGVNSGIKSRLLSTFPGSRTVNPVDGSFVDKSQLSSALVTGMTNWVLLETDNISVISDVTSALNGQRGSKEIVLLTTLKNNSFDSDNISNRHLSNLQFRYPSVDREYAGIADNSFVAAYHKKYGIVPNTYAVRGFDVTLDVLLRLASSESLTSSMEEEGATQYIENKFDYEKGPAGGFYNKAIYIISYAPDMTLKVIK